MKPPPLAALLLRMCAPPSDRVFLQADLEEEFVRIGHGEGASAARRWYWRQTAASIPPLLLQRLRRRSLPRVRLEPVVSDARQALRYPSRHRGLTATVLTTLTVGMTATLAAGLLYYAVVVRPLPFERAEALVSVRPSGPRLPALVRVISLPDFADWQQPLPSIAVLSGYAGLTFTVTEPGEPRRVDGLRVGPRFAELFGRPPMLGRDFEPKDFVQGGQYVALLGYAMWQREFGGDPSVVGRSLFIGRA